MSEILKYKGYIGSIDVSFEDNCLHGKLLFVNDLVTYEASEPSKLKEEFEAAVDDYIVTCSEVGKEPEKPFSGSFNIRIESELHRTAAIEAKIQGITLNEMVKVSLEEKLTKVSHIHHHIHNHIIKESSVTIDSNLGENAWLIEENAISQH